MPAPDPQVAVAAARLALDLKRWMWNPQARCALNEAGVHLTRAHFYSSIPSMSEIVASFEYQDGPPPYADSPIFDAPLLRSFLRELLPFAPEFAPPVDGDSQNPTGFFWSNPEFGLSDAMAYWCVLRRFQPEVVLEVGAGFSTMIATAAVRANGRGRVICVEPFPKPFLSRLEIELVQKPVQELPLAFFAQRLTPGSVLFIDSTHTVKTGSDCLHLYLRILPRLEQHLYLHAHDIFLPSGYPRNWLETKDIHWTEQYLLLALLQGNPHFRMLFGSHYHLLYHPTELEALMGGKTSAGGGSFWFERIARG